MSQLIIEMTADEITALSTEYLNIHAWIDNFATDRARVIVEEYRKRKEWPDLRQAAINAGTDVSSEIEMENHLAVYAYGVSAGLIKTAQVKANEAETEAERLEQERANTQHVEPLDRPISKRQLNAALILEGILDPDAFVETALQQIADPVQRALAINDWKNAPGFHRGHALFSNPEVLEATSFTAEIINQMWLVALQQER